MIRGLRAPFGSRAELARARLTTITTDPMLATSMLGPSRSRSPRGDRIRSDSLTSEVPSPFRLRSPCGDRLRPGSLTLRCSRSRTSFSARSLVHVRLGARIRVRARSPCGDRAHPRSRSPCGGTPALPVRATHPCSPRESSRTCLMRSHLSMLAHAPCTCSSRSVHVRARLHDRPFDLSCLRGTRLCSPICAFTSSRSRSPRIQDLLAFRRSSPVLRAGSRNFANALRRSRFRSLQPRTAFRQLRTAARRFGVHETMLVFRRSRPCSPLGAHVRDRLSTFTSCSPSRCPRTLSRLSTFLRSRPRAAPAVARSLSAVALMPASRRS